MQEVDVKILRTYLETAAVRLKLATDIIEMKGVFSDNVKVEIVGCLDGSISEMKLAKEKLLGGE